MGAKQTVAAVPKELMDNPDIMRVRARWMLKDEEVLLLYQKFLDGDMDGNGTIRYEEFFHFNPDPQWRLHGTVFNLLVPPDINELDFPAWTIVIVAFCFMTTSEISEQIFAGYDSHKMGRLSIEDLHNLLASIHGDNPLLNKEVIVTLTQVAQKKKGKIDFDDFLRAVKRYPMLLYPIERIQKLLRAKIFGTTKKFREIDLRTMDVVWRRKIVSGPELQGTIWKRLGWEEKKEALALLFCGYCCCKKPPRGIELDVNNMTEDTQRAHRMLLEGRAGIDDEAEEEEDGEEKTAEEELIERQMAVLELYDDSDDSSNASFTDVEENENLPPAW